MDNKTNYILAGVIIIMLIFTMIMQTAKADPYKISASALMEMAIENEDLNRERTAEYHKAVKRKVRLKTLLISRVRWINNRNQSCYDIERGAILVVCLNTKLKQRIQYLKNLK